MTTGLCAQGKASMLMSGTIYIFEPLRGIGQMLARVPMGMGETLHTEYVQHATLGCTLGNEAQRASGRASPHGRC